MKIRWLLTLLSFACIHINAKTIYVPQDYSSFQNAIYAAFEGDTIRLASGTYDSTFQITKSITIIGIGRDSTILTKLSGYGIVLTIRNTSFVVIQDVGITPNMPDAQAMSVFVDSAKDIRFINVRCIGDDGFGGITGSPGGDGVYISNSESISFKKVILYGGNGGGGGTMGGMPFGGGRGGNGLFLTKTSNVTIDSSEIKGGYGGSGGCSYRYDCAAGGPKGCSITLSNYSEAFVNNSTLIYTYQYDFTSSLTLNNVTNAELIDQFVPREYFLNQNYPNPFNPSTTISFSISSKSFVSLKVFDLIGRDVATIISEELPTGNYSRLWNAKNMPSGIYFYRLSVVPSARRDLVSTSGWDGQAGSFIETKKLVLLR